MVEDDFGLVSPWYRRHEAKLVERIEGTWGGVRLELVTRMADGPCVGGMYLRDHVVSFLIEGRRSGVINKIEGGAPHRVGQDSGWTRIVPAERHVQTQWDRGRRTYLMAFVGPDLLKRICRRNGMEPVDNLQEQVDLRDQRFARFLGDLAQELRQPGPLAGEFGEALAAQLCIELIRLSLLGTASRRAMRGGLSPRVRTAVLDVIDQHSGKPLSVQKLAAVARLSPNHFAQAFRESTGLPPSRYVLEQRLSMARRLLKDTQLSITEVALRVGFTSSSAFAMAFRRATGLSPSEWRRAV